MEKESLLKMRDFLLNIDNLDIPKADKVEIIKNLYIYLDPENYERHTKCLAENFNEEIKWGRGNR